MATARCPRTDCTGTSFEMKELNIRGANYRHLAVQCSTCGAVVGVTEIMNLGYALQKIGSKLGISLP